MNIHKQRLAFLDPEEPSEDIVYPEIKPCYFKGDIIDYRPVHHGLFDETPEQISHGMAPWDKVGWSRDGVI